MNKEDYIKIVSDRLNGNSKEIMLKQINNYYKYHISFDTYFL